MNVFAIAVKWLIDAYFRIAFDYGIQAFSHTLVVLAHTYIINVIEFSALLFGVAG